MTSTARRDVRPDVILIVPLMVVLDDVNIATVADSTEPSTAITRVIPSLAQAARRRPPTSRPRSRSATSSPRSSSDDDSASSEPAGSDTRWRASRCAPAAPS